MDLVLSFEHLFEKIAGKTIPGCVYVNSGWRKFGNPAKSGSARGQWHIELCCTKFKAPKETASVRSTEKGRNSVALATTNPKDRLLRKVSSIVWRTPRPSSLINETMVLELV